mgnify:CR=1 FL=1
MVITMATTIAFILPAMVTLSHSPQTIQRIARPYSMCYQAQNPKSADCTYCPFFVERINRPVLELLGIPDDVLQVALLPVGYTKGTDFKRANRPDPSTIIHYDKW